MHPEQKPPWIEYISHNIANQEIKLRQKEADYTETESAMTSRHDHLREDLAGEINTQRGLLAQQRAFLIEIRNAEIMYQVGSGAYLDLVVNGEPQQFLFMDNKGELPDIEVVTSKSPFGRAIQDKIPGDKASFTIGSTQFDIEIKSIL